MQEGFGAHTFRFINEAGESHFVRIHWTETGCQGRDVAGSPKKSGKNPDFQRQDLWEAIESGNFPEWEMGVQLIPEADEHKFGFDLLDPTKLVPVTIAGRMVLNRNPGNFFAKTEQVAFHLGHVVPGFDFTNDPLLQEGCFPIPIRKLSRLGSPNFHEISSNRSISLTHNNKRYGHMRQEINKGA